MALDGDGQLMAEVTGDRLSAVIGRAQSLGDFRLIFPKPPSAVRYNYLVSYVPGLDKIQETLTKALHLFPAKNKHSPSEQYIGLSGKAMPEGIPESRANLIVYQVSCTNDTLSTYWVITARNFFPYLTLFDIFLHHCQFLVINIIDYNTVLHKIY